MHKNARRQAHLFLDLLFAGRINQELCFLQVAVGRSGLMTSQKQPAVHHVIRDAETRMRVPWIEMTSQNDAADATETSQGRENETQVLPEQPLDDALSQTLLEQSDVTKTDNYDVISRMLKEAARITDLARWPTTTAEKEGKFLSSLHQKHTITAFVDRECSLR